MWHPYRYLIAGRTKWEIAWFDLDLIPDPRAWLEKNLVPKAGPLIGCERVPGAALTGKEAMAALGGP
jgi:hypothetical protein